MSLLTLCQDVAVMVGLNKPSSIINNTDSDAQKLLAIANMEGRALSRRYDWQLLVKETSFTTIAAGDQGAVDDIAPGFDRFISRTVFKRNQGRELFGSLDAHTWQFNKSWPLAGIYDRFRVRDGHLLIIPTPTAGDTIYFEYISKYWVNGDKEEFTADTDTPILSDELVRLGMIYRTRASLGLDYSREKDEYEKAVDQKVGTDVPRKIIKTDGITQYPYTVGLPNGSMPQ